MAQMYPSRIPDYILRDPYRKAEIDIYNLFSEQLSSDYVCYYSRPWLGLMPDGSEKDGEADFVIAHRDKGFLTIEVKGGYVARREGTEQWVSTNRLKITNKIKDPVNQARTSKHTLLQKLKEYPGWKVRYITVRHGVILPDNSRPGKALAPDAPLFLFAFGEDLKYLAEWVASRFVRVDDQEDTKGNGLGSDGLNALHKMLSGAFELRPHHARALANDSREIERLTGEQFNILTSLEGNCQMSISGGAGTGKTILALEKACRAAEEGKRTLLVCFNNALGDHLEKMTLEQNNIKACSFHSLCGSLAKQAGVSVPNDDKSRSFYEDILPSVLLTAVSSNEDLKFDTIIVDEGQDFQDTWLATLKFCLHDIDKGQFYVFYDDNQKVYNDRGSFISELPPSSYRLSRNLRNTRSIHKTLSPWYSGRPILSAGPEGIPVDWIEVENSEKRNARVTTIVSELISQHDVKPEEIAVLTGVPFEGHPFKVARRIGKFGITELNSAINGAIVFDTVRRFKGLERKCVVLTDIENLTDPELVYVALSRPSIILKVIGSRSDIERIKGSISI